MSDFQPEGPPVVLLHDFDCDECGRMFASIDDLSVHMDEHDETESA